MTKESSIEETPLERPAPPPPKGEAIVEASTPHPIVGAWQTLGDLGDVFGKKPPPRRWLLTRGRDGVLPLGKVGIFAAAGGVGKTMACVQLALAVATGRKWLGSLEGAGGFDVAAEGVGHVLLALGEEDAAEVVRRVYDAARAMRLTANEQRLALERIVVLPLAGQHVAFTHAADDPNVETSAAAQLREKMKGAGEWRLVIFDPLSRFAGPDAEKDNAAATRFIETAETFCKLPGDPTVLVVHHSAQASRTAEAKGSNRDASHVARGATGITDGARWVAALDDKIVEGLAPDAADRLRRLAVLEVVKNNYAKWSREPVMLRRDGDNGGALLALDEHDERMVREAKPPKDDAAPTSTPPKRGANVAPSTPTPTGRG